MYDSTACVIYVGKAKNLKNRLSSYFRSKVDSPKTQALVANIAQIEVTITHTETEALILEHNLIKKYLPRYNVLLRDDKSYPFIFLSAHKHPRLSMHRGAKKAKGRYFGPYPNGGAVRESLHLMQKIFPIRQCSDSEYANRTRPCLQYQLKRCSAPCVGFVTQEDYQHQIDLATLFLEGKGQAVINDLVHDMQRASDEMAYEKAAMHRDQIQAMRRVSEQQFVSGDIEQLDCVGFAFASGMAVVHLLLIRQGSVLGSRSYYPKVPKGSEPQEVLRSFIVQYYLAEQRKGQVVKEIILSHDDEEWRSISDAISNGNSHKTKITVPQRGDKAKFVHLSNTNAQIALQTRLNQRSTIHQRLVELESLLEIESGIKRMECFDISHTQGELTVASCVVFNREGPLKSDYRKFNIEGITGGDDYAAMAQALSRRYRNQSDDDKMPTVLFIDGGKGQLSAAYQSIDQLDLSPEPLLVGVAKGVTRKAGLETLLIGREMEAKHLPSDNGALHLIQHIRDESHRFAITGHRQRRDKARRTSVLEGIDGVGPKRRQNILKYLGGLQEVQKATVLELEKVPGISKQLAQTIYDALHH
ncbi:excinuclease ABC subunit UvrC [Alginatibacterium sediminis]